MKEMDLTMPVDQWSAVLHIPAEKVMRVCLFGWIWMDSRYSQSWPSLYLPLIEAQLSYDNIREGSAETEHPRVPERIVMAQSP